MKKNNVITLIISLLAAVCLWIYVVTVVNPDGTTTISNIPVTFSGAEVLREDQGLMISGDYQDMVTVSFSGKNTDLKKLEQGKDELMAVVDVSKIRSTRDYTLTYDLSLPENVQESAVTVTDRSPGNITVHVEKLARKPVPVKGDFSKVEVAKGYMLDSTTFDYDTVTVEGAESVVNSIEYALVSMNRSNVDKTITEQLDYTLVDANGDAVDTTDLTMDIDAIDVTLTIVMYKEVKLDVDFIDGGGATSSDVSYQISPETITLSGDATALSGVNTIQLDNIDLSTIMKNEDTVTRQIMIPNNATNVSGEQEAKVTIRIKNKEISTIRSSNITFSNVAEGFEAKSISQQIQVTFRASTDDIRKISANNVRIIADMSEYTQPGTYQVPVDVTFDGFAGAGVIGEYTVAVTLSRAAEE